MAQTDLTQREVEMKRRDDSRRKNVHIHLVPKIAAVVNRLPYAEDVLAAKNKRWNFDRFLLCQKTRKRLFEMLMYRRIMNRLCLEGMCKRVVKLRNEKDVIRIVVSDGFSKDTLNDAANKI